MLVIPEINHLIQERMRHEHWKLLFDVSSNYSEQVKQADHSYFDSLITH